MNQVTLTNSQLQFFIDSQDGKIQNLQQELDKEFEAKIAIMNYIKTLGREHVLACAKFVQKQNPETRAVTKALESWHDETIDLSVLNDLHPDGDEYFKAWSEEEKTSEIK